MKIRYFDLPAKEKRVLDLIMENGKHGERDLRRGLSKEMGVAELRQPSVGTDDLFINLRGDGKVLTASPRGEMGLIQ